MNTNELKSLFAGLVNLKSSQVAVRKVASARPDRWVEARIRPDANSPWTGKLSYPNAGIPELVRRCALLVVYGPDFARRQSVGGNVQPYSISLFESQWDTLAGVLAAIRTCADSHADDATKLDIAIAYIANRTVTA